jgi:deazaflavin-dependent oxidoreductase (nitroreductase family)
MSDETRAALQESRKDWIAEHREMYLSSGGALGHIMDITAVGGRSFATHCMIRYVGRKSGKVFITPLCYGDIGGEVVIVASKGGADKHPNWFLNITAAETVDLQIATEAFRATWRVAEGGGTRPDLELHGRRLPLLRRLSGLDGAQDPAPADAGSRANCGVQGKRFNRAPAVLSSVIVCSTVLEHDAGRLAIGTHRRIVFGDHTTRRIVMAGK